MELRRAARYPVHLECTASSRHGRAARLSGRTVNASHRGVLVSFGEIGPSAQLPVLGEHLRIVLKLPEEPRFRQCWVDCMCRVVRVDEKAEAHLVAFAVQRYWFRPSLEGASEEPWPGDPGASGPDGPF
jgi:hypothetical protein